MGVSRDVRGDFLHHNEAISIMARTKRTLKSKACTSKQAKHTPNLFVECEGQQHNDSATDVESVYVEENPLPDIPLHRVTHATNGNLQGYTKLTQARMVMSGKSSLQWQVDH